MGKALWTAGLGAGLALLASAAVAEPDVWFLGVVPTDQSRQYVDALADLQMPDGYWTARIVNIMPDEAHGFAMLASEVRVDCARHAYQYVSGRAYDRRGRLIREVRPSQGDWTPTAAASGTAAMETFVCEGADHPEFRRASGQEAALPTVAFADWSARPRSTWRGGWSFAHWGMTRPEIRSASKGAAHAQGAEDDRDVLDAPAAIGPFRFGVAFDYTSGDDDGVLTAVVLSLQAPQSRCPEVRRYLEGAGVFGGKPRDISSRVYRAVEWSDRKEDDLVTLEQMRGFTCELRFEPLHATAPNG